jgi:flagellar biosynthetic protein FliR
MLQNITVDFVFQFLLIFVRIGTAFSMLPVLGDRYILMRIRLFIAATFSFLMQPLLKGYLPNYIDNFPVVVSLIGIEILIGLLITIGIKFYFQSISIVGQIIAMQSGLGSATFFDPTQRAQIAIFGNLLFLITTVSLLVSEVHHLFIQSIIDSYELFPTGKWGTKDMEDMNKFIVETLNDSFILAFKISAPF